MPEREEPSAASSAYTGPRRSSTSSTRRSAASSRSCTQASVTNIRSSCKVSRRMTLAQLALDRPLLGVLGLASELAGHLRDPRLSARGILLGPNGRSPQPRSSLRGDRVRRRARARLPALLPRARIQPRPARDAPAATSGSAGRSTSSRTARRPFRRAGGVRLQLRRPRPRCGDLRLVERDHGQGPDRLPPPRRRRDRPHARDPALRGPRDRLRPRVRGDRRRLSAGTLGDRRQGVRVHRRSRSRPRAGWRDRSTGCSTGCHASSSCSSRSRSSSAWRRSRRSSACRRRSAR